MSSWAEDVDSHRREKHRAPPREAVEAGARRARGGKYERRYAGERAGYNPVVHRNRDEAAERRRRRAEEGAELRRMNRGADRAARREAPHDLITHRARLPGGGEEPPNAEAEEERYKPQGNTDFNVISNLHLSEHHFAPPERRPPPPAEAAAQQSLAARVETREFDILSNRYFREHEGKSAAESERELAEASRRYWKTHTYDCVRGEYCDPRREASERRREEAERRDHGKDHAKRLPPTLRNAEGQQYSIVAPGVARGDGEALRAAEARRAHRHRETEHSKSRVEARIHEQGERAAERDAARSIARVSHQRYRDAARAGADPISHVPFGEGVGRTPLPPARTSRQPSAWERIQAEGQQ